MPVSPDPEKLSEEEAELALDSAPPDSRRPFPKVTAQATGGVLAGAVTVVVLGILDRYGVTASPAEAGAVAVIIAQAIGFAAGYQREG